MYPKVKNSVFNFAKKETLNEIINDYDELIPYGNGRSYGDSALSDNIINVKPNNYFISFDEEKGFCMFKLAYCFQRYWNLLFQEDGSLKLHQVRSL